MRKFHKLSSEIRGVYNERLTALEKKLHVNTNCQHHHYFSWLYVVTFSKSLPQPCVYFLKIREEILRKVYNNSKIKYAQYRDYASPLTISALIAGSQCTVMDKQITSTPPPIPGNGGGGSGYLYLHY